MKDILVFTAKLGGARRKTPATFIYFWAQNNKPEKLFPFEHLCFLSGKKLICTN